MSAGGSATSVVILYVASTRPAKIDAAREAVAALARLDPRFGAAEIRARGVGEVGPRMPMTEAAIIETATARVRALVALAGSEPLAPGTWFAGLEGGLDPVRLEHGRAALALKSWACVSDGHRWSYGAGGSLVLPDMVAARVTDGRELGDVVDEMAGAGTRGSRGAWGLLTRDLVTRRDAFRVALLSAFAPFLTPELYGFFEA